MALLTAQQVSEQSFKIVRFKEGYDLGEVDDFLDQVVAAMTQQQQRIAYLEGRLSGSASGGTDSGMGALDRATASESMPSLTSPDSETLSQGDGFSSSQQVSWEQ